MGKAYYSILKAAWHTDRIDTMRRGEQAAPVSLQLVLSDLCNHDCWWCAYRASNGLSSAEFAGPGKDGKPTHNPNRMIATPKATEIITDAHEIGVKSVTFTGGGEPTVHPDHIDLFRLALGLGMDCSLNTNGNLLRPGWEDVLPRFAYVRFSIDGGTAQEYGKDRRVSLGVYSKVLGNLAALVAEVGKTESPCVVGAGYVVTGDNYVNLDAGVRRIRDTGAKYVRLASVQSTDGTAGYGDKLEAARAAVAAVQSLATPDFQVVNLFDSAMGRRMTDPFCGFQQMVMYVGANLKIYRCCYTAYSKLGESGDLAEQSLADWFRSEEKRRTYADFDARSCSVCPLADKNDVISYMVSEKPTHVNFV
jgi:MoaA/NifB/PqqE/SkfB family radical SAM enzyme